jgi:hypothetical protein
MMHLFEDLFKEEGFNLAVKLFHSNQKSILKNTSKNWKKNAINFFQGKKVKYLLICEAPPCTGEYFYSGDKSNLLTIVWNTFFSKKYESTDDAYKQLAEIGFLMVDSLPYAMNYSFPKNTRNTTNYKKLIDVNKEGWINNLDKNFDFESPKKLRIVLGFKLNGHAILKATNREIVLKGNTYTITEDDIADGNILPSTESLKKKFLNDK